VGRGYRLPKTSDVLCVPMRVSHICHFDVYKGVIQSHFPFMKMQPSIRVRMRVRKGELEHEEY